ncbi:multidrug efflux system membrane fusion protein [Methylobacterium sp. BE186]|uniref:efflux RND transporter periplasmic adaptor subunit n=1 Tax=Methylobacterium sp. BE186 TaxID=2817715 RepID=UPI00285CCC4E|nr:efflux RND transporter periplasmic adaptor subunit [Methylobacterium sp. BE186]MDR7040532.1 multidrug efflux system membrane fusion protein [Methylobacterium sp. BE186]
MQPVRLAASLGAAVLAGGAFLHGSRLPTRMEAFAARGDPPASAATGLQKRGPEIPVRAEFARVERVPLTRIVVGWVEPVSTVRVRARIEGEIVERLVEDGSAVAEGDILFRIDDSEIRAVVARDEAALAKDRATLARLEADLGRALELRARSVATQVQVDQLTAETRAAAATVAAAEATLRASRIKLGYTVVRAPIAGRVGVVRNARGDLVGPAEGPTAALLTITPMSPLQVSLTLPERDLDALRAAMSAPGERPAIAVFLGNADRPAATGRVRFIDSAVDSATGTILVKARVPNADGALWPGQYARLSLTLDAGSDAVTVPLAALVQDRAGTAVFVVRPDGTAARRPVEPAETVEGRAVIRSGLGSGERVVVEGQARLFEGASVAVESRAIASAGAQALP